MTPVLLDTNIVSYLAKKHPLATVYALLIAGCIPQIAFVTLGELHEGAQRDGWSSLKFEKVYENLGKILVLESNPTIARQWGWLRAVRRRQPISENDGWIAATALAYDIPLVTHNRKDFLDIPGLRLITAGV